MDTVQEERITEQSIEEKVVVEESLMVEQQQPEQPVKEKEKITAEQIDYVTACIKKNVTILRGQKETVKFT